MMLLLLARQTRHGPSPQHGKHCQSQLCNPGVHAESDGAPLLCRPFRKQGACFALRKRGLASPARWTGIASDFRKPPLAKQNLPDQDEGLLLEAEDLSNSLPIEFPATFWGTGKPQNELDPLVRLLNHAERTEARGLAFRWDGFLSSIEVLQVFHDIQQGPKWPSNPPNKIAPQKNN